jgi:hypothetical protein
MAGVQRKRLRLRVVLAALLAPAMVGLLAGAMEVLLMLHGSSLDLWTPLEAVLTMAVMGLMISYPLSLLLGVPTLLILAGVRALSSPSVLASAAGVGAAGCAAFLLVPRVGAPPLSVAPTMLAPSLSVALAFCLIAGLPWRGTAELRVVDPSDRVGPPMSFADEAVDRAAP